MQLEVEAPANSEVEATREMMRVTRGKRNAKYLAHLRHPEELEEVGSLVACMVYHRTFGSEILVVYAALSVAA